MGFDPRQWSPASKPSQRQRVTSNVEALLVENDALRHEVRRLREQIQRLRTHQFREKRHPSGQSVDDTTADKTDDSRITASQIDAWGQNLSQQV